MELDVDVVLQLYFGHLGRQAQLDRFAEVLADHGVVKVKDIAPHKAHALTAWGVPLGVANRLVWFRKSRKVTKQRAQELLARHDRGMYTPHSTWKNKKEALPVASPVHWDSGDMPSRAKLTKLPAANKYLPNFYLPLRNTTGLKAALDDSIHKLFPTRDTGLSPSNACPMGLDLYLSIKSYFSDGNLGDQAKAFMADPIAWMTNFAKTTLTSALQLPVSTKPEIQARADMMSKVAQTLHLLGHAYYMLGSYFANEEYLSDSKADNASAVKCWKLAADAFSDGYYIMAEEISPNLNGAQFLEFNMAGSKPKKHFVDHLKESLNCHGVANSSVDTFIAKLPIEP